MKKICIWGTSLRKVADEGQCLAAAWLHSLYLTNKKEDTLECLESVLELFCPEFLIVERSSNIYCDRGKDL